MLDSTVRCDRCGWPLAGDQAGGCVPGNCSCRCSQYPICGCGRADGKSPAAPDPRDTTIAALRGEIARLKGHPEDETDKPPMPDHDYARQWASDTTTGKAGGGRYSWGERNLARSYLRLRAELAAAREEVGRKGRHIELMRIELKAMIGRAESELWHLDASGPAQDVVAARAALQEPQT